MLFSGLLLLRIAAIGAIWAAAFWAARQAWSASLPQTVLFLLCVAVFSTLCVIAPDKVAFFVALAGLVASIGATFWSVRAIKDATQDGIEAAVLALIADATASPPVPRHDLAVGALASAVGNAVRFLREVSPEEDYALAGEASARIIWRWQRVQQTQAILDNLSALAHLSYALATVAAEKSITGSVRQDVPISVFRPALLCLIHFIAFNETVAPLLVAPLPYSQAEYRAAIEDAAKLLESEENPR
jgi:hypothetical protein